MRPDASKKTYSNSFNTRCCTVKVCQIFWINPLQPLHAAEARTHFFCCEHYHTGYTQKNGAISKGNKEFISHFTWAQRTPSAAETVQVSHALPAVRFSCLMRGSGASSQDGVAAGKGFLCAPF